MRREKFAELGSGRRLTKTANQLPLVIDDADARAEVGDVPADRGPGAGLVAGSLMEAPSKATKRQDWLQAADERTARGLGRQLCGCDGRGYRHRRRETLRRCCI